VVSEFITRDVGRFIVSKPEAFTLRPGHGVELAIPGRPGGNRATTEQMQ